MAKAEANEIRTRNSMSASKVADELCAEIRNHITNAEHFKNLWLQANNELEQAQQQITTLRLQVAARGAQFNSAVQNARGDLMSQVLAAVNDTLPAEQAQALTLRLRRLK
jgi:hypothetical protein